MKIQDLIKIKDSDTDKLGRSTGIIIKLDWHYPDSSDYRMRIAQVLWSNELSWIDASRVEKIKDSNELSDEQLEDVRGGMSYERFELWKIDTINNLLIL